MKTKLSGIRPSPCQLYIQWIRKDWSKTSLSLVIVLPDLTWRPLFTRCCKDLNCVQISVASLRIIAGLLSWNVQLLPASTLHRNSLSSPYLYSPHDISEKKSRPFAKLTHPFPWQRSRVSTHSALLVLAGSSHSLAPATPGGYVAILDDVMSVREVGHSLSWTTEKPEPGAMQRQGFVFFF